MMRRSSKMSRNNLLLTRAEEIRIDFMKKTTGTVAYEDHALAHLPTCPNGVYYTVRGQGNMLEKK